MCKLVFYCFPCISLFKITEDWFCTFSTAIHILMQQMKKRKKSRHLIYKSKTERIDTECTDRNIVLKTMCMISLKIYIK